MAHSTVRNNDTRETDLHLDAGMSGTEDNASRATKGVCNLCGGVVGDFYNAWIQLSTSYSLPALTGSYSSYLSLGRPIRAASVDSELDGCGRNLFLLSKIQFQCEAGLDTIVAVEPRYITPVPVYTTPLPDPGISTPRAEMEVDSRPAAPLPSMHHFKQHSLPHSHRDLHQPLQQVEVNRQSLPPPPSRSPPAALSSSVPQKSPSNPPVPSPAVQPVKPVREAHHVLPPPREIIASPAHHSRELPAPIPSHQSPIEHSKDQMYPRSPRDVQLDAIERLQTQVSQNSSALVAQTRDMRRCEEAIQHMEDSLRREFQTHLHQQSAEIRRVDDAVGRLQHEMRGVRELIEVFGRELHASGGAQGRPGAPSAQDSALELMAQQIAVISAKANDVETLKITIEIMKNKIQRLESSAVASPAQPIARQFASPREPVPRSLPSQHTIPSHLATPPLPSHPNAPIPATQKLQSYDHSRSVLATPEAAQRTEPSSEARPPPSGWAAVNAGMKRTLSGGVDSPQESGPSPGSPKRTKLAPIEPRAAYANSQGQLQHIYDHADTDDSDAARVQTHRHTLPSQPQSTMPVVETTLPSQHPHAAMIAYGTPEAQSDDSWRHESQRIVQVRTPRGRGSRGGPGSRGGRVRKSMASQVHPINTPEWERVDWQGVPESQVSPDGYYTVARMNRPIVRRGSGGGGTRGGRPTSSNSRAASVSLGLQGVTTGAGVGLPADPYAHTKKTRTKPIRNADGVLIRKDGRPDMRSQSSAANLRKVHSRTGGSENPEGHEHEFTPSQQHTPNGSAETSSPVGGSPGAHDNASVRKKHSNVMSRMFPGGVDESRKELDYAHKVFEENEDHTAHPRMQHQHHEGPAPRPQEIKREQMEEQRFDTQSPGRGGDVDMERPEDHADDEGQTPGGQSESEEHGRYEANGPSEGPVPSTAPDAAVEKLPANSAQTPAASSTQA